MSSFFDSGRVADLILALLVVEGTLLLIVHLRTGRGPRPMDLMGMLLPGALLVLALRAALSGGTWPWIALFLSLALPLHLLDLTRRWRR